MRIASIARADTANGYYRSVGPMTALRRRGHELRQLSSGDGAAFADAVRWCDVLHIHRFCDEPTLQIVRAAKAAGAAVVWDDDDNPLPPKKSVGYQRFGGMEGERLLAVRRRLFALADLVTTPSAWLAESFRAAGAAEVRVIENYLADEVSKDRASRHDGVVVGWLAAKEHHVDVDRLPVRDVLQRLLDARADVQVVTIGLGLGLTGGRYRHVAPVAFGQLLRAVSEFDVGIAPLADVPFNAARSNVKLKEYAAGGVPWLASPVGPYVGMGEEHGGRLVADGQWAEELDRLVAEPRTRRRLAKRAARWGRGQTVARHVQLWEEALAWAVRQAGGGG